MIAADRPVQRPRDAKLLVADRAGHITHAPRARLLDFLRAGDLVIANDAATLPASLHGVHLPTGIDIEVRLAGRSSLVAMDLVRFTAVVFGAGDYRTRTEDRELPPSLEPGDVLAFGRISRGGSSDPPTRILSATVEFLLDHPRLVTLRFRGSSKEVWAGLARHGRPIQYAHVPVPLALWDVWTPIAGLPVAFEPPSASFALDWGAIGAMRCRDIAFQTVTLAAGISSTGDPELDRRLPFDEPYRIPESTAAAIHTTKARGGRIVAVGTTVVRALEHAAARGDSVRAGDGVADQRMGPDSRLRVVDAVLSGTHEPDSSHYQLLRAFADDATLARTNASLEAGQYRTHEFGDSVLIEKQELVQHRMHREADPEPLKFGLRAFGDIAQEASGILTLSAHPTGDDGETLIERLGEGLSLGSQRPNFQFAILRVAGQADRLVREILTVHAVPGDDGAYRNRR